MTTDPDTQDMRGMAEARKVGLPKTAISIRLTPYQAKVLWQIVDGALDAGACEDGLTKQESDALNTVVEKILGIRSRTILAGGGHAG